MTLILQDQYHYIIYIFVAPNASSQLINLCWTPVALHGIRILSWIATDSIAETGTLPEGFNEFKHSYLMELWLIRSLYYICLRYIRQY